MARIGAHLTLSVCTASQTIVCGCHFGYAGMRQVLRERAGQKLRHGNGGAAVRKQGEDFSEEQRGIGFRRQCADSGGSGGPYGCGRAKNRRTAPGCCRKPGNITPFLGTGGAEVPGRGRTGGGDREKNCRSIIALTEQRGRDEEMPGPVRAAAASEPRQSRTQSSFSNA